MLSVCHGKLITYVQSVKLTLVYSIFFLVFSTIKVGLMDFCTIQDCGAQLQVCNDYRMGFNKIKYDSNHKWALV
jgi:hypothetical protein